MRNCLSIDCNGETLLLHPDQVIYWPRQQILFAADVHVGKEHRFGRSGIAIPGGISETTLAHLFGLCDRSGASRLIILGDFMHAKPGVAESWLALLSQLLDERPGLHMEIVAGNHDKAEGQALLDNRVRWHRCALVESPFVLQHEPSDDARGYVLCGHIHPAWRLSTSHHGSIRTPVFWFRTGYAVLPAFGGFTGAAMIKPDATNDRIFMAGTDCVIEIPASARIATRQRRWRRRD